MKCETIYLYFKNILLFYIANQIEIKLKNKENNMKNQTILYLFIKLSSYKSKTVFSFIVIEKLISDNK